MEKSYLCLQMKLQNQVQLVIAQLLAGRQLGIEDTVNPKVAAAAAAAGQAVPSAEASCCGGSTTITCKIKVSNSISIRKCQNNPKQFSHSKTYNFRNDFKRFSSRFELLSDRLGLFLHYFLRLFSVVVVVIATLLSASSLIDR